MLPHAPLTEADILADVIGADDPSLPLEAARSILGLKFNAEATERINELLDKNRQDQISPTGRSDLDKFLRVGQFINLLQAKARTTLKQAGQ